jgi:outer membrane protein
MKKIFLASILASTTIMADVIGGEVNLGYYNHTLSGTAQNGEDIVDVEDDLKLESEDDIMLRAYIEHPIPALPNIRLGYRTFNHEGSGAVSKRFTWGDLTIFEVGDNIDTNLDLDIYDATLYYEILDNWLNLDLGLNVKYLNGSIDVSSTRSRVDTDIDLPIPMLYGKARFDVPTTDLSFQVEGDFITYDDNTLYDLEAGIRYTLKFGVGFEVGYKTFKIKIDDLEDISMDADFNGVYSKLVWDF